MNTARYKSYYKELCDKGALPRDLYDELIEKIDASGEMTHEIFDDTVLAGLERRRLFDVPAVPYTEGKSAKTDGTYVYRNRNPLRVIAHGITSTIFKFLGWFGSGLFYGLWHFPRKYAKKFKGVGACITVSNHVGYVDAVLTRRALGVKKQNIIVAPFNCKKSFGGAILRSATVVPLPSSFKGVRPFMEHLRYLKSKGSAIHFYAESCMWTRYRKPRPYKDGAFFYADKLDVPVVPMLYCFKEPKGLRKLFGMAKAVIRVADPVYPDGNLSPKARQNDLADRVAKATKDLYEEFYGLPLKYLDEIKSDENGVTEIENADPAEDVAAETAE